MDPRVALLKTFSGSFVRGEAKIEAEQFGFAFVDWLLSASGSLQYGELTDTRLLHKYKLVDISEERMDELLQLHVMKHLNVCRYFGADRNDAFCFNVDNNHTTDNTAIIPEISLALATLTTCLLDLGCKPLVIASGRGYHVWVRLDEPVDNALLYEFMVAAAARALLPLFTRGDDHRKVKFSFYPDIKIVDSVSLRLFGTEHAKNKTFSYVLAPEGLLDESASWKYFEHFVASGATSSAALRSALEKLRTKT